jgi:hypothetical protein
MSFVALTVLAHVLKPTKELKALRVADAALENARRRGDCGKLG